MEKTDLEIVRYYLDKYLSDSMTDFQKSGRGLTLVLNQIQNDYCTKDKSKKLIKEVNEMIDMLHHAIEMLDRIFCADSVNKRDLIIYTDYFYWTLERFYKENPLEKKSKE